jgi:hypothetical protein
VHPERQGVNGTTRGETGERKQDEEYIKVSVIRLKLMDDSSNSPGLLLSLDIISHVSPIRRRIRDMQPSHISRRSLVSAGTESAQRT